MKLKILNYFILARAEVSKSNKFICFRDKNVIHWKLQQIIPDKKS